VLSESISLRWRATTALSLLHHGRVSLRGRIRCGLNGRPRLLVISGGVGQTSRATIPSAAVGLGSRAEPDTKIYEHIGVTSLCTVWTLPPPDVVMLAFDATAATLAGWNSNDPNDIGFLPSPARGTLV
jgi:hypothetical protein